jgi:hypothetical protein
MLDWKSINFLILARMARCSTRKFVLVESPGNHRWLGWGCVQWFHGLQSGLRARWRSGMFNLYLWRTFNNSEFDFDLKQNLVVWLATRLISAQMSDSTDKYLSQRSNFQCDGRQAIYSQYCISLNSPGFSAPCFENFLNPRSYWVYTTV